MNILSKNGNINKYDVSIYDKTLRVAGFLDNSLVNGEGLRSVLFLSGCPLNCEGCQNEKIKDINYGDEITIRTIIERIKNNMPLISGVTISGGEPTYQTNLYYLLKAIKEDLNLNVWCYTGYIYEDLLKDPIKSKLFKYIDVLVDGPFIKNKEQHTIKYIGSSNQRVIKL